VACRARCRAGSGPLAASIAIGVRLARNTSHRCPLAAEAEELGIVVRELRFGLHNGRYRILFIVFGSDVHVLHVRHVARDAVSVDGLLASGQE
jgi:hypothetical protein